jgi:type 1 glutamine amidotransferase
MKSFWYLLAFSFCALAAPGAEQAPLRVCLLSASAEYESDKSLAEFQKLLETKYHVVCHRAFGKDKGDGLPGLEALDKSDVMLVFTRRVKLPPEQLERLKRYIAAGKPIIGIRTASHAFADYPEFDKEVLGGDYKGHLTNSEVKVSLVASQTSHPILEGVTSFTSRKLYKNPEVAKDVTVLLRGSTPDHTEPVAWTRVHNGGRVFYTSLGTQEDFHEENFRRLLLNAIFWAANRQPATP